MVKSTIDYEGWKKETKEYYLFKFPSKEKYINGFIDYVSLRYDKFQRVFLPKKVLWYLYSKRNWVIKRNQHYWFAALGKKGGEGKSSLTGQILYFLDGNYSKKRIAMNFDDFIRIIRASVKESEYPAISLDEPENSTHVMSKKGASLRDILERIRQLNMFVGCCANSLTSIPPFVYERLSTIIFVDDKHRFWLWDNSKDEPRHTVVDDIKSKTGWGTYRHAVFKQPDFVRRAHFQNQNFSPELPYDTKDYLSNKKDDLLNLMDSYLQKNDTNAGLERRKATKQQRLINEIKQLQEKYPHLTHKQIGKRLGYSRKWIDVMIKRAGNEERAPL